MDCGNNTAVCQLHAGPVFDVQRGECIEPWRVGECVLRGVV